MTRTVLIVEDADVCRVALELAFMRVPGLAIRSVATAEEALEWLESNQASVLVTDVHLPRMDGFELVKAIRLKSRSMPIIADQWRHRSAPRRVLRVSGPMHISQSRTRPPKYARTSNT